MSYRRSMELPSGGRNSLVERLRCPVCLNAFEDPKVLSCFHFFCAECLEQLDKVDDTGYPSVLCPFCKQTTKDCDVETSPISDFITRPIPTSSTSKKASRDKLCAPCTVENTSTAAVKFCTGCNEYMCSECDEHHRKFRITKNHVVIPIQDMPEDAALSVSFYRQATCACPQKRETEFLCKEHSLMCCSMCAVSEHKPCANVIPVSKGAEELRSSAKIKSLIKTLEEVRSQLKCIRAYASTNSRKLKDQVTQFSTTLKFLRKDINHLIDCMETEVSVKGDQLLKEHTQTHDEQVNRCSSFISAIEMSRSLIKKVDEHGSSSCLIETFHKIDNHSEIYRKLVSGELSKRKTVSFEMVLDETLCNVAKKSSIGAIQVVEEDAEATKQQIIAPIAGMSIERESFVRAVAKGEGKIPRYSGAAYLYNGFVVLVDCNNNRCVLFDPQFNFVSCVKLSSIPWQVTTVGSDEIAVSLPYECKVQFLCFEDDILKYTTCLRTRLPCWGIVAINEHEMAVAWDCKGPTPGVGIIAMTGEEILFLGKDDIGPEFGPPWQFDFDTGRNRFIISLPTGSVLCVDVHGGVHYVHRSSKLINPSGVAVDRDGNVYVCGMKSHNIHQLNVNGDTLRIIAMPNLRTPFAITFNKPCDGFLVSTVENREELQVFIFKESNEPVPLNS